MPDAPFVCLQVSSVFWSWYFVLRTSPPSDMPFSPFTSQLSSRRLPMDGEMQDSRLWCTTPPALGQFATCNYYSAHLLFRTYTCTAQRSRQGNVYLPDLVTILRLRECRAKATQCFDAVSRRLRALSNPAGTRMPEAAR